MKITTPQINHFLKNIPNNIKIILLYGVDLGLISELTIKIKYSFLNNNSNNSIMEYDCNDIKKEPSLLQEAIHSNNLFAENNKKVITITNSNAYITQVIQDSLAYINSDVLLILLAEDLPSTNSLRKLCEKENDIASIACFHDTEATLTSYIKQTLSSANFALTPEALEYLLSNLGNDRLITQQELEKLMLYKGEDKSITLTDVIKVIDNNNDLAINDLIFDITLGNYLAVYQSLPQFLMIYPAILIIRVLGNTFKRLILAKCLEQENLSINEIAKKLKPPILYLHLSHFKKQLSQWNINNINLYLKKLIHLELEVKKNPSLALVLINKLTLDIHLLLKNK